MDVSSLIGGLGIGSVLTLFLKEYFDQRKIRSQREYQEKRDAYINYLDIVTRSQTMPMQDALWARACATERVKLCGSSEVRRLLDSAQNASSGSRKEVDDLFLAMRNDLFPKSK